jgi:hypothetical protein
VSAKGPLKLSMPLSAELFVGDDARAFGSGKTRENVQRPSGTP